MALQRIHDLTQANEEQSRFYRALIAKFTGRDITTLQEQSVQTLVPVDEADSNSHLTDEIHHLQMSLQTAHEDVDMLQKANGLSL